MPSYDFRCKQCGTEFTKFYKSYKSYEAATPTCPACTSQALSRVIKRVNVQAPTRDYAKMNANEMLSVLESGDKKQVDALYKQVSGTSQMGATLHEKAQKTVQQQDEKAARKQPKTDE